MEGLSNDPCAPEQGLVDHLIIFSRTGRERTKGKGMYVWMDSWMKRCTDGWVDEEMDRQGNVTATTHV